ncbi:dephospho-CoA kinase [Moheibacter lacus]|uniref:Dephospho-CoA kinase n=1 Tax=Moheibacter lacus TaxID=2745851 RepID=A0A838ZL70_9FLAO|nr:dephospho-CoA kinase [Moheibacter lacus]MBA5628470.1 dephospho-CoA kinase [Moheibacter lacus]
MKIVGLTGGIGSGKSTIAKWFLELGIPVYNADLEAKKLMNENEKIIAELTELFGEEVYQNGIYNRKLVSSKVFQDKELLHQLNQIVHPEVFKHFQNWVENQASDFVVKEAAILFESGSYKDCDLVVSVVADEEIRIKRVLKRDEISEEQIRQRINNQWTDTQRIEKSDFVIENNSNLEDLKIKFDQLYKKLLKRFRSS